MRHGTLHLGAMDLERLQQAVLSPDQGRAQLAAGGYPASLLDAYLGVTPLGGATPAVSPLAFSALQSLGLATGALAPESLRVDTGFIRLRSEAIPPESLAVGNYVFGVDVFRRTTTQFL